MDVNDNTLISGSLDLRMWNLNDLSSQGVFSGHKVAVNCVKITKDNQKLISIDLKQVIIIWNLNDKSLLHKVLKSHKSQINDLLITPDNNYFITNSQETIKIWSLTLKLNKPKEEIALLSNLAEPPKVSFYKDKLLSQSNEGLQLWHLAKSKKEQIIETDYKASKIIMINNSLRKLCAIVGSDQNNLVIIDLASKEIIFQDEEAYINCSNHISISDNGKYLVYFNKPEEILKSIDLDELIKNDKSGGYEPNIVANEPKLNILLIINDGRLFGACTDGSLKIWEFSTGNSVFDSNLAEVPYLGTSVITQLLIFKNPSQPDMLIASLEDSTIRIISLDNYSVIHVLIDPNGAKKFCSLLVLPNYNIVSGSEDSNIRIWDLMSLNTNTPSNLTINSNEGFNKNSFATALSLKSKYIPIKSPNNAISDLFISRPTKKRLEGHQGAVTYLAYQPKDNLRNEYYLISASKDLSIIIWDLTVEREYCRLTGHMKNISGLLSFKSDLNLIVTTSFDKTIKIWNITEKREETTFYGHSDKINDAILSTFDKNELIITCSDDKSIRLWNKEITDTLEISGASSAFERFCALCRFKSKTWNSPILSKVLISKDKLNFAHIFCGIGAYLELGEALACDCELRRDCQGNSPLAYAIKRNSVKCIDVIILYLEGLRIRDHFIKYCYGIRNDINQLLAIPSSHLPIFFTSIFMVYSSNDLPSIAAPKQELPVSKYGISTKISKEDFIENSSDKYQNERLIEFKVCTIPLPIILGSNDSIDMLKALENTKNNRIFRTQLIKMIIDKKWEKIWWIYFFFQVVLLWGNLIILIMLLSNIFKGDLALEIAFILINFVLFLYELTQFCLEQRHLDYFLDYWNDIDLLRVSLSLIWIILLMLGNDDNDWYKSVSWNTILINFARGLTGFRLFNRTRFYVQLIIRSVTGTISFFIIFIYTTIAFGVIFSISGDSDNDVGFFDYVWKVPFDLSMGSFDSGTEHPFHYSCFLITSFLNVIIILNLLISILGDEFEKFQIEVPEIDQKEKLDGVLEIENLLFWRRNRREYKHMQLCSEITPDNDEDDWQGKIKVFEQKIGKLEKSTKLEMKEMKEYIQKEFYLVKEKNEDIFKSIEDVMKKLDKIERSQH